MSNSKLKAKALDLVEASGTRVALYLRVSTDRQRQHDLSIPDQRAQVLAWCETQGHEAVAEFVEATTGTDDKRPVFQQMIERACDCLLYTSDAADDLLCVDL